MIKQCYLQKKLEDTGKESIIDIRYTYRPGAGATA